MSKIRFFVPFWIAGIAVFGGADSAGADIYRYVDPNGVVHFTNAPTSSKFRLYIRETKTRLDGGRTRRFDLLIHRSAKRYGVDVPLVLAMIKVESDFDPLAVSDKGAMGLMQLMPETARQLGVRNTLDPVDNIAGGVKHLRSLLDEFEGRLPLALAAYNAGRDTVLEHKGIPPFPETQNYIDKVLKYYVYYGTDGRR